LKRTGRLFILVGALMMISPRGAVVHAGGSTITYLALAKFPSLYEQAPHGVLQLKGVTAAILGVVDSTFYFVRFLTLDAFTGRQIGTDAYVGIPLAPGSLTDPCRVISSDYFFPGDVLILGSELQLIRVPLRIGADGSPQPKSSELIPFSGNTEVLGLGHALAELTGAAFADGQPRLFIGTSTGKLLVISRDALGTPSLQKIVDVTAGEPISDLGALPQLGRIDLGVSSGSTVYGLKVQYQGYQTDFRADTRDGLPVYAFKVLNRPDQALASALGRTTLAYSDGYTATIHFASLAADVAGTVKMDTAYTASGLTAATAPDPSLIYILRAQQSSVQFRPGYPDGSSVEGCTVNVTDSVPDECTACPIWLTGDVDESGTLVAADLILLVKYVFQGGAAPRPCPAAADVDCSSKIDAKDVIFLVNYLLLNGPAPCNVCSLFNGTWTCP
jgi:hypothetical protein